jgi:dihydropyrimidinase
MFDSAFDCVVLDGMVVTAADVGRYDIAIKDGKIALLAPARSLVTVKATRVIDAQGAYVMVRDRTILRVIHKGTAH